MKKNLMSVLILALVLVNLILTGILTITILPQTKKSNELVNKVCSAIDLELESGDGTESASIPMDQIVTYKIEDAMTINLKTGADGETRLCKALQHPFPWTARTMDIKPMAKIWLIVKQF